VSINPDLAVLVVSCLFYPVEGKRYLYVAVNISCRCLLQWAEYSNVLKYLQEQVKILHKIFTYAPTQAHAQLTNAVSLGLVAFTYI
jgi:hypothetical protein